MKRGLLLFIIVHSFAGFTEEKLHYFELTDEIIPENGIYQLRDIAFDFDHNGLRPESKNELDKIAYFLLYRPELKVEFRTHTDQRGNSEYNLKLSHRRSQSIVDYCEAQGVPIDQLLAKGCGETMPYVVRKRDTAECSVVRIKQKLTQDFIDGIQGKYAGECAHQLNRRTEMVVIEGGVKMPERNFEIGKREIIPNIVFDFDKATLRPQSDSVLRAFANDLKKHPHLVLEIGNHRDCRGSDFYSTDITRKRAEAVVERLVDLGIERERLIPKGYGETTPTTYDNKLLTCHYINTISDEPKFEMLHQKNRRTDYKVLSKDYDVMNLQKIKRSDFDSTYRSKVPNILFKLGQSTLKPASRQQLLEISFFMKTEPNLILEIGYHYTGYVNPSSSISLAQRRADTIVKHLIEYGIKPSRMVPKGYREIVPRLSQTPYIERTNDHIESFLELVILSEDYKEPPIINPIKRDTTKSSNGNRGIEYDFD